MPARRTPLTASDNGSLHVLYVAWGFIPHRGPGAYRPLATVNELAKRGYRVTVLTADLDTFDLTIGGDRTLLAEVDPRVRVLRVPMLQDALDPMINRWPQERAANQRAWVRRLAVDQVQAFPEVVYSPWGPRARAVANALHREDPVDLTIATGNPYVDFTVALALNAEHGVPFVLDDRDSWILNVYTGDEGNHADRVRPWLEYALDATAEMWFVNPPLANWHREAFPQCAEKIRVVENGWDPRFLTPADLPARPANPDRLTFSFVGTINSGLPLRLLAEAWREARRRSPILASSELRFVGHFGHAGVMTAEQSRLRAEFTKHQVLFTGRQPKHALAQTYAEADVLVFAKEGSRLVTSGKVYEYVATGRPIVSMIEKDHDARRVLDGYPRWHDAAEHTVDAMADAMVLAAADALNGAGQRDAALAHGASHRRDAVLARALDQLEQKLAL